MANADLKTFLEDRLRAMEPTIDLDTGSPAQVQFIEPVLTYLGTDPFETDIDSFISDRFRQEFPDIFGEDPGVVRDIFVKPLILLLEPFKRETQSIKRNQSLKDPTLLSDDDADALVANVFDERVAGSFSSGTGRVFFSNPTNVQIEITNRIFTADGLSFFPTNPLSITAEEMVFNTSGSLFYLDVPLKAEKEGTEYNIDVGQLSGIDGQFGVVKVTNLQKFENGSSVIDTPTFVASAHQALNERSLVTRRGATAKVTDVFQTELRAFQVIGAKDAEMERDLLVATSPGHSWIMGDVFLYKSMALVLANIIDGDDSSAPVAGDTLFVYLNPVEYPSTPQPSRFVRLTVDTVYMGPIVSGAPYQMMYLVQFSGSFPSGISFASGVKLQGGFSKKGVVQISSMPDFGATNLSVNNGDVHVFGHTDFYVRPILQSDSTAVFSPLSDEESLLENTTLSTLGLSLEKNKVEDPTVTNFTALGVAIGDLLSIETGDDVGIYVILKVNGAFLNLNTNLTNSQTNLRYRIIKNISINPFEPRVLKFPFGSLLANDLLTTIGSKTFTLATNDILGFGAQVGDIIRVTSGIAVGDYTITGFDSILGGRGPIVDKAAPGSANSLTYEVFTALEKVNRPLVRIKDIALLDSSQQSTGISIPYADPLGASPTSNFTSARVRGSSGSPSGFTLPSFLGTALTTYISGGDVAAGSGDTRYSSGFDIPVGTFKPVQFADGTFAELDYRATPGSGAGDALDPSSYFVAVSEELNDTENFPPVDPKAGDALFIKSGPNKGSYLIKDVVKFKHRIISPARTVWTYFIKIHGQFPVDVFGQLFDFLNDAGGAAAVSELPITGTVAYPDFFVTLFNSLGTKFRSALSLFGASSPPSAVTLQAAIEQMVHVDYDWGDPARGVLRTYMQSPTLFEQRTGLSSDPTTYSFTTPAGDVVTFRPDPNRYTDSNIIPARLDSDPETLDLPRDLDLGVLLAYTGKTTDFNAGATLSGAQSGATATVAVDLSPGSASGSVALYNVVGAFSSGEAITDNGVVVGSGTAGASLPSYASAHLTDVTRQSAFLLGVVPGDTLAVHEEIFFHGTDKSRQTAVQTVAGSTQITAPSALGPVFSSSMVGELLYIEQGTDKGGYRVVKCVDAYNLILDKTLSVSTPTLLAQGPLSTWGYSGSANFITSAGFDFAPYVGKYVTIYGMSYVYQGSYQILTATPLGTATVSRTGNFAPGTVTHTESDARFVITNAPTTAPTSTLNGTELHGLRPIRVYEANEKKVPISSVPTGVATSAFDLSTSLTLQRGQAQPYRVFRPNIRRVTPTEMEVNTFGPLVFFDTEVVSTSPESTANVSETSYLTVDEGTYSSLGYRHRVTDRTLSYSMQESGFLDFSPRILPVGSSDSQDNFVNLIGASVQVTYEQSDLVRRIQEYASSAEDRVSSANILVRHFLPAYVSYDATYLGGSAGSVIASDIITYINSLSVETALDVSLIQDLISKKGGNPITPTTVQTILHDWRRRRWLEFSSNQIGGTSTDVPYDGTPRVSFFIPGPDVSGKTTIPSGERINLTRQ